MHVTVHRLPVGDVYVRVASRDEWSYPAASSANATEYPYTFLLQRREHSSYVTELLYRLGSLWWSQLDTMVSPFDEACLHIWHPVHAVHTVRVTETAASIERAVALLLGAALLVLAPTFSRSLSFYYAMGAVLGVLAAVFLLVILLSRLNSDRLTKYHMAIATVAQGFVTLQYSHLIDALKEYTEFVAVPVIVCMLMGIVATRWVLLTNQEPAVPMVTPRLASTVEMVLGFLGVVVGGAAFASRTYGVGAMVGLVTLVGMRRAWGSIFRRPQETNNEEDASDEEEEEEEDARGTHVANRMTLREYWEYDTQKPIEALVRSNAFADWLAKNNHRVWVNR